MKHFAVVAAALIAPVRTAPAQQLPPIRQLGAQIAIVNDTFGSVTDVRQLSGGRLLINDGARRRLMLFDSSLSHGTVVADTTSTTSKSYPATNYTGLLAYRGDTTVLVDPLIFALLVVDPRGKIVRVISAPHPTEIGSLVAGLNGTATFDARGRLVYRLTGMVLRGGGFSVDPPGLIADRAAKNPDAPPSPATQDSVPVVAVNMESHASDTLGFAMAPRAAPAKSSTNADGTSAQTVTINPITQGDIVAHLADGSTAIIRAQDYHIDWINADETRRSTPKMAHYWTRLTDSAKAAIVDSVQRGFAQIEARRDSLVMARTGKKAPFVQHYAVVDPSALPDYMPPFSTGGVLGAWTAKGDAENNLWIREGWPAPGSVPGIVPPPAVFDVVNRQGVVVDRVQMPPSLTLIGFGPGVAYLTSREGAGTVVAKYRIH